MTEIRISETQDSDPPEHRLKIRARNNGLYVVSGHYAGSRGVACALEEGAPLEADRLSAEAELRDAYFLPVAAEAAQAHELDEHIGALQRKTVTAAVIRVSSSAGRRRTTT